MDSKERAKEVIAAVAAKNLATFMPRDEFEGPAYSAIGPDNAKKIVDALDRAGICLILKN